jgi:hypothetical protein
VPVTLEASDRTPFRLFAVLFAILVPLISRALLQPDIGVFSLLLIIGATAGPGILYKIRGNDLRWLKYVSAAAATIFALAILIGILVTPLSAYIYWFDTFKTGVPQGGVGSIFVLLITFFSSIVSPLVFSMGLLWPLIIVAFVALYLLAIIVQTDVFLFLLLTALAAASIYYMVRTTKRGAGKGSLVFSILLILVTLVGAAMFPEKSNPRGSNFINQSIYPNLRKAVVRFIPGFPLLYGIPGYGISFDEKALGGRPHLNDRPLLDIEGPPGEVVYLRTRVFDLYNGQSWAMTPSLPDQRIDSLLLADFFSKEIPSARGDLKITVRANAFSYIPYPLNTSTIFFDDDYPELRSGNINTGFELARPFKNGTTIEVDRLEETRSELATLSGTGELIYLQIPDDLPPELNIIAEGLARDTTTRAEILGRIEAFLAQNYAYDLDVPEFVQDEETDFVYSFLFQDAGGYCVQFATSFIILARLNGIPARYSTGYLAYIPQDGSTGVVTGLSAHAWPEVWLEDSGWINWEATPAANIANYTTFGNDFFFNYGIDLNDATARQLEGLLGRNVTEQSNLDGTSGGSSAFGSILFIAAVVLAGLALLGGTGYLLVYPAIKFASDDRGRFYFAMKRFSRKLERRGVPDPKVVGWLAWSADLRRRIGSDGKAVDDMAEVLLRLTYGGHEFLPLYPAQLTGFRRYIREHLFKRKS